MSAVSGEALALLRDWLPPDEQEERPQIQLATVDATGRPDVRTVLLSAWDEEGFLFHTDRASRKAAQIDENPSVAIAVLWPGFTRQLVVRGAAEPLDHAALLHAYGRRSPYLQQLAWQNTADLALLPREDRVTAWRTFGGAQDAAALGPSDTWSGYRVRPDRLTFWRSDPDGPSHRVEFRPEDDGTWSEHHLPG